MAERILRLPDVKERTGLSRTTIYRKMKEGAFPMCVKLGAASGWKETEVESWVGALPRGGSSPPASAGV